MVSAKTSAATVIAISIVASAHCKPNLDETTSRVSSARFLAVRAEPAEGAPLGQVTFTALYVDESGERADASIDWAFCDDRKPLAELGPVSPRCLQRSADFFEPIGVGTTVAGALPQQACRQFGPDVPETTGNDSAGRPVDPDSTGGYYQPMRLVTASTAGDVLGLGLARITCGVPGASSDQLADLKQRNHPNTNTALDDVAVVGGVSLDKTSTVSAGQRITLSATWAACADGAPACTGAEHYANYDTATQTVNARTEAIRVSWFATDGTFDDDRTGVEEGVAASFSNNAWTAPSAPGTVHMWIVIRDDRGGVGWKSYSLDVR